MASKRRRVLILADSLGCPREGTPVENTWVDRILQKYSDKFIFYTYCEHGLSARNLKLNYIEEIKPEIIIVQIGIVDAVRRALPLNLLKVINAIKVLQNIIRCFVRKNHYFLTKTKEIHYCNLDEFKAKINTLVGLTKNSMFVTIAPPGKYMCDITYNVEADVAKYNEAIIDIANSNSQTVANPYADISDFLLEDGHHLNSVGVDAVYKSVDSYLMGLLDSNE